ncbi:MAG TPA: peptidylprolyl isomerase [Solirubrobacterales bacterium]|nr:peptidylprolyl isomerase [Solirubrobacterales bacterium]
MTTSERSRSIRALLTLVTASILVFAIAACGDSGDETTAPTGADTTASGEDTTATTEEEGCRQVQAPKPKDVSFKAPKQVLKKGEEATVVVKTNCGTFEIALDTERAPKTANSFAFLAEVGFYDDLTFHRVVPGFVIQGGDPEGTGIGGPGYTVDEAPPANLSYTKGVVAMAKSEVDPPGRSGSQFYVVTAPDAGLPPEYALVGRVSDGFETITRIEELGGTTEKPSQTVLIEEATVEQG